MNHAKRWSVHTNFHHVHVIMAKEVDGIQVSHVCFGDIHDVRPGRAKRRLVAY